MLKIFHHWWLPILSAIIWWGMLIALLACWTGQGNPTYAWMNDPNQHILFISDIAASNLQPIFISCSGAQGLLFVLALASERWLRHSSRLRPNVRKHGKYFSIWAIVFAVIGELGILFVSIFNTRSFHKVHESMLIIFIVFVGISSLSSIAEYFYLNKDYQSKRHVIVSLYSKIIWFIVELGIAIAFACTEKHHENPSAVLEWTISFIYPFYSFILAWDLWPAYNKQKGHYPKFNDYGAYPTNDPESMIEGSHVDSTEKAPTDF